MSRVAPFLLWLGLLGLTRAAEAPRTGSAAQVKVIPLWSGIAPGSEGWTHREHEMVDPGTKQRRVWNVVEPSLTGYFPDPSKANGTAVIVCPGGAFRFLTIDNEGHDVARWLRERGVAAFVLKYRLLPMPDEEDGFVKEVQQMFAHLRPGDGTPQSPGPSASDVAEILAPARQVQALAVADGAQAIKLLREHAREWGLAPDRIGILGFSAGALVTSGVVLRNDPERRPDFAAPIYGAPFEEVTVPAAAPPAFIAVANDDFMAAPSARLYAEWKAAGRPVELHVFSKGGHGFGMTRQGLPSDRWIGLFFDWLGALGLLEPPS